MKEKQHNKHSKRAMIFAGALSLVGIVDTVVAAQIFTAHRVQSLSDINTPELAESYAATVQSALSHKEAVDNLTVFLNNEFDIDPSKQAELGIDRIYSPINMGGGTLGYAIVDPETGKTDLRLVDINDGKLLIGELKGKTEPFIGSIQVQKVVGNTGYVLAINDSLQTTVGLVVPHL